MPSIRIDSREVVATGWSGVREAMLVPIGTAVPGASIDSPGTVVASRPRRWMRAAIRVARDAAIGLLLLTSVPVAVVGVSRGSAWSNTADLRERLVAADRWRPFMARTDQSITPLQAGRAFHTLESPANNKDFPEQEAVGRGEQPWMQHPLPANAFAALRNPGYDGPVASRIIEATRGHFSAVEMTYLRAVAEAPLWHEFDRLASASRVDLIGGQFVLPFKDDALLLRMPYRRFADTKSLAYAGVSRAAYFLATGQPLQAEAALRSIVSFGFVFIDNGTSAIEAMVGRVIVGIGIDGLHQLYTVTGNTEGVARTAATSRSTQPVQASSRARLDMDDRRGQLLDNVANPQLPRTLRYESLRALSFTTCGSVQEMLLGPSAEVRAAFDRAQRTLSRYPSERALIELMYEATNRPLPEMMSSRQSSRLIVGAAAVAGTVLNNPRIEACTRVALALGQ